MLVLFLYTTKIVVDPQSDGLFNSLLIYAKRQIVHVLNVTIVKAKKQACNAYIISICKREKTTVFSLEIMGKLPCDDKH